MEAGEPPLKGARDVDIGAMAAKLNRGATEPAVGHGGPMTDEEFVAGLSQLEGVMSMLHKRIRAHMEENYHDEPAEDAARLMADIFGWKG